MSSLKVMKDTGCHAGLLHRAGNQARCCEGGIDGRPRLWLALGLAAFLWAMPAQVRAQPRIKAPDDHWFALDLYVGAVVPVSEGQDWDLAGRMLLGYSVIKPYWYVSVGPVVGFSSRFFHRDALYGGLGLDLVHITTGLSGHLSTVMTWDGGGGAVVGVGWSVLSADLELMTHHGRLVPKLIFSLRIAVGGLSYALKEYLHFKRMLQRALHPVPGATKR